jgi:hypothetical protein
MMDRSRINSLAYLKFCVLASVITMVLGARRNCSGGLWLPGNLTLDLFAEFQGPGNLLKNFGSSAGAPHDDGSVAQQSSKRGFLDGDAFDSGQEQLDGAAIREAGLYDNSLIGDGHLRGIAPNKTDSEKGCGDYQTGCAHPSQHASERSLSAAYGTPWREEQAKANQREDCGDESMSQHHNPVEPGLILDGFAGDEVLFGVAQRNSLKEASNIFQLGSLRRRITATCGWTTAFRRGAETIPYVCW